MLATNNLLPKRLLGDCRKILTGIIHFIMVLFLSFILDYNTEQLNLLSFLIFVVELGLPFDLHCPEYNLLIL